MENVTSKKIVIDLDDTISKTTDGNYLESVPCIEVVEKLREYKSKGFKVIIYSSRNMRTYSGNIGLINVHTLPVILDFLDKNDIPYDEVILGKPWPGKGGFYVDDKAIRPSEFISMTEEEITDMLKKETDTIRGLC